MSPADREVIVTVGRDPDELFAKTVNGITSNYLRYSVRGGRVFDELEKKEIPLPADPRIAKVAKILTKFGVADPEKVAADVIAGLD